MRTVVGEKVFITKFAYRDKVDNASGSAQKETVCYIKVGDTKSKDVTQIVEAIASCDSRDNFNKSVGRTIAFKRAMQELFTSNVRIEQGLTHNEFALFIADFKKQCSKSAHLI